MIRNLIMIIIAVLLTACSATTFNVGNDFNVNAFTAKVERGATTKDQVRAWLGEPNGTGVRIETDGQRFDEWTYYYASGNFSDVSATHLKTLQIKFDTHGIVQGYDWSTPQH